MRSESKPNVFFTISSSDSENRSSEMSLEDYQAEYRHKKDEKEQLMNEVDNLKKQYAELQSAYKFAYELIDFLGFISEKLHSGEFEVIKADLNLVIASMKGEVDKLSRDEGRLKEGCTLKKREIEAAPRPSLLLDHSESGLFKRRMARASSAGCQAGVASASGQSRVPIKRSEEDMNMNRMQLLRDQALPGIDRLLSDLKEEKQSLEAGIIYIQSEIDILNAQRAFCSGNADMKCLIELYEEVYRLNDQKTQLEATVIQLKNKLSQLNQELPSLSHSVPSATA